MSRSVVGNTTAAIVAIIASTAASASQGPGVAAGTASAFTQTVTALIVYGGGALIIVTGLIGGLRRH